MRHDRKRRFNALTILVILVCSGAGWFLRGPASTIWAVYRQDYETKYNTKMNVAVFLQMVKSDIYTMRLSRIDLTADYKDYPNPLAPNTHLNPNILYSQLIKGRYVIKNCKNKQAQRMN